MQIGGGAALLVPVHPTCRWSYRREPTPGARRRAGTPASNWELFWGTHGYNYHSMYSLCAGLFVGGRHGLGGIGSTTCWWVFAWIWRSSRCPSCSRWRRSADHRPSRAWEQLSRSSPLLKGAAGDVLTCRPHRASNRPAPGIGPNVPRGDHRHGCGSQAFRRDHRGEGRRGKSSWAGDAPAGLLWRPWPWRTTWKRLVLEPTASSPVHVKRSRRLIERIDAALADDAVNEGRGAKLSPSRPPIRCPEASVPVGA